MRVAVFTSKYPARVATFFERDMRSLLEAGVDIDVFSVAPLNPGAWRHSLDLLGPEHLPRHRIHHLELASAIGKSAPVLRRNLAAALRDAFSITGAALPYGPMRVAKTLYVLPKAWAWAGAWAAAHTAPYDHVLAYWGNYAGTCAYAFHRLAMPQVPFTIWLHAGTDLYVAPLFMREKLAYADNVITCCEFNRRYITSHFGDVPEIASKLHVCHHGLNLADFPCRLEGRAPNRVLAVGRLARDKGFDYLIRAAHVLAGRQVDIVVEFVGDGPERERLQARAAELGIADRVTFHGWRSFPEVRTAMQQATMLVHPSDRLGDGLPNVIREAMASGLPVIGSDVAGLPDALSDGCGVLVPPRNVDALADAIADLLHHPDKRAAIARRARARTEERYDLWRNGERLAKLLSTSRRNGKSRDAGELLRHHRHEKNVELRPGAGSARLG
jgi:glycosyltransferase involved in cell wall biosynthesis